MNAGLTAPEIAEILALPDVLARQWFNRGYYGTMSHNAKAVYQRYLGWYDANPANLNPLPPEPAARKYVAAMGGEAAVMALAAQATADGDLRWAATLLNHAVFANDANQAAREQLAGVYTTLGYQAEAGTWRNIYLTGAQELRGGPIQLPPGGFSPDMLAATTTAMLLDFAAVRVNPRKAAARAFVLILELTDRDEVHCVTVGNGVLVHEQGVRDARAAATVRLTRPELLLTLFAGMPAGDIQVEGEQGLYLALVDLIEPLVGNFAVVTP
jgi:alkyl sulfatase BDS1-like metallo-beta-lactamase superfamily hydrolase